MPLQIRLALALLAQAVVLAGCSIAYELEAPEPKPARKVHDCRDSMSLFRSFTVHATSVEWSKAKDRKSGSLLSVNLQFANTDDRPLALSNSESGVVYTVTAALTGADGKRHTVSEMTGAPALPDVHVPFKPAETKTGKLVFKAPHGRYTLSIERSGPSQPISIDRGHLVAECTIAG